MGERSFVQRKRNPLAISCTSGIHPNLYRGGASKGALNALFGISRATDALEHMRINNLQFFILRVPKHSIFPRLEGHNPLVEKKWGHCEYHGL